MQLVFNTAGSIIQSSFIKITQIEVEKIHQLSPIALKYFANSSQ